MEVVHSMCEEGMKGGMDITLLTILGSGCSPRFFQLEIEGKLHPGIDIGWVSLITVRLWHSNALIGEIAAQDMSGMQSDDYDIKTRWDEGAEPGMRMDIRNMRQFRSFLQGIMPKNGVNGQLDNQIRNTADLSVSQDGHTLLMSIDLSYMARMTATVVSLIIDGSDINITVEIRNMSSLELFFNESAFVLKKGQQIIGKLEGDLNIVPGTSEFQFDGQISSGVSGMATLKGDLCDVYQGGEPTWRQHAIKLFEVEVNLGNVDVDVDVNGFDADIDDDGNDIDDDDDDYDDDDDDDE